LYLQANRKSMRETKGRERKSVTSGSIA
jgi:hypothetical protein